QTIANCAKLWLLLRDDNRCRLPLRSLRFTTLLLRLFFRKIFESHVLLAARGCDRFSRDQAATHGFQLLHASSFYLGWVKLQGRVINVGRQDLNPETLAFGNEGAELVGVRHLVAHHRRHEFHGIVRLKKTCLITNPCISSRVGAVEPIACELLKCIEHLARPVWIDVVQVSRTLDRKSTRLNSS